MATGGQSAYTGVRFRFGNRVDLRGPTCAGRPVREITMGDQTEASYAAQLQQFIDSRLPVLLGMQERVDTGGLLSENDIEVMSQLIDRAQDFGDAVHDYPEFKPRLAQIIELYEQVTERALENEENAV
jgi:hypothetical protein